MIEYEKCFVVSTPYILEKSKKGEITHDPKKWKSLIETDFPGVEKQKVPIDGEHYVYHYSKNIFEPYKTRYSINTLIPRDPRKVLDEDMKQRLKAISRIYKKKLHKKK